MPIVKANENMLAPQSWGHLHGFPMNADVGAHVGSNPQYMYPQPQFYDYYAPPDLLSFDQHSHQDQPLYERHASMGGHLSNVQAEQAVVTKITQCMQNPLSYVNAVIGESGANKAICVVLVALL
ncbi:hypothetical protein REPUB_Repub17cG0083100 [Reevesia pubescens]